MHVSFQLHKQSWLVLNLIQLEDSLHDDIYVAPNLQLSSSLNKFENNFEKIILLCIDNLHHHCHTQGQIK